METGGWALVGEREGGQLATAQGEEGSQWR